MNYTSEAYTTLSKVFRERKGWSVSYTSRLALGNSKAHERVKNGRLTLATINRAIQFFSDNWPADLAWPEGINRPASNAQSQDKKGAA